MSFAVGSGAVAIGGGICGDLVTTALFSASSLLAVERCAVNAPVLTTAGAGLTAGGVEEAVRAKACVDGVLASADTLAVAVASSSLVVVKAPCVGVAAGVTSSMLTLP